MIGSVREGSDTAIEADVSEVFVSAQGEGIYLGQRQTFVRFVGCNLCCRFCDTQIPVPCLECRIHKDPASDRFDVSASPLRQSDLLAAIDRLTPAGGTVSLTGGEPLLQAGFLQGLLGGLKRLGVRTYLETNGTLPRELARLIDRIDIVAMDVKLPTASGQGDWYGIHERFLNLATAADVFVKAVVTGDTDEADVLRCAGIVASVDSRIPLVLQPVTPVRAGIVPASQRFLLGLQASCQQIVQDVRIIPQCHRIVGMR